jgi:hypothetical protein
MENETQACWQELCAQAALEHDSTKLLALATEINRVLEEKEQRQKVGTRHGRLS